MQTVKLNIFMVLTLAVALLAGGYLFAQHPERDISAKRHPNLAAAQRLSAQAYQRILDAQQANEWDLNGHAQKAKELLDQVNHELKEAAESSNEHHEH
jgi:ribosomal protein L4